MISSNNSKLKKYTCKICNEHFELEGTIYNHVKNLHDNDKTLIINNDPKPVGRPKNSRKVKAMSMTLLPITLVDFISSSLYRSIFLSIGNLMKEDNSPLPEETEKEL